MPPLLVTHEVAEFVARGVLAFPGVIGDDLNEPAAAELTRIAETWGTTDRPFAATSGDPFDEIYPPPSAVGAVLRHPAVRRIVDSLVGPDAVFDHDFVHVRAGRDRAMQSLHADAIVDPHLAFDIQVFYFPHAVGPGGGGTGYVPGTHLRRVHETQVGRYRHLLGEQQWHGPAGSILVFHHGLWHRGMPNPGSLPRLMYKIRLDPVAPQVRRWDTSDLPPPGEPSNDHVFATFDPTGIPMVLRRREPWMGEQDHRLEVMARTRLWRYLTGDPRFDVDWYHTRLERRAAIEAWSR